MPLLQSACLDCHDQSSETGLDLETLTFDLEDRQIFRRWVQVLDQIMTGKMPPESEQRPDATMVKVAATKLEEQLRSTSLARQQEAGRVPARRLTKREYGYAIQDLLDIDADVTSNLPEESDSGIFDTIGSSQRLSAIHMESLLRAADEALEYAIRLGRNPYRSQTLDLENNAFLNEFHEKPLDQGGNISRRLDEGVAVFRDVDYLVRAGILGFGITAAGNYRINATLEAFQSTAPITYKIVVKEPSGGAHIVELGDLDSGVPQQVEVEVHLRPGDDFYVTLETDDADLGMLFLIGAGRYSGPGLAIRRLAVEGPLNDSWPPPSTRQLLDDCELVTEQPDGPYRIVLRKSAMEHIRQIVSQFAERAFRRPINDDELDSFVGLAKPLIESGVPFAEAVRVPLRSILTSPQFLLFSGAPGRLDDANLASRLSFFLTKSIPDRELRELAAVGKLSEPEQLAQQVDRLLDDPISQRFIADFLGQWLRLYKMNATSPDEELYPEFDEPLGWSLPQETQLFFADIVRRNLPVGNLIDSDYTFVNRRLAEHYGIEGVVGQSFRQVELPRESIRGGILTQAAILKTTANGTSTSPVTRGNFVLSNFLGTPPPPPPPNVGSIEPDTRGKTTIREILDAHRDNTSCNRCHRVIDPPGFALECFDPVGGFRTHYRASGGGVLGFFSNATFHRGPIADASGITADGEAFSDIEEYKILLHHQQRQVARNLVSQFVAYSTGGEIEFADRDVIESILDSVEKRQYPVRDLLHAVIQSRLFREK